jgi:hypothetical protein
MDTHLSDRQLEDYRQGRLAPALLLSVDDHLSGCESCRRRALDAASLGAAVASLRAQLGAEPAGSSHASFEDLAALADGARDGVSRERLQEHLEACSTCAAEAHDLQLLRARLQARPRPRLRLAAGLAAAAAACVAAAWLGTLPLRNRVGRLEAELDRVDRSARQQADTWRAAAEALESELQRAETRGTAVGPGAAIDLADARGPVRLDAQGRLEGLGALPPALEERLRRALWSRRVRIPVAVVALAGAPGRLRGPDAPPAFTVLSPVATAVESDRPTFRWAPLDSATSYVVRVSDARLREVAASRSLPATIHEWRPEQPLPRGASYVWQVTAVGPEQEIVAPRAPEPEARFVVLGQEQARDLARDRQSHDSHLLLGVLYAEAGLLDEAARELQALRDLNPGSETARGLAESLRGPPRPPAPLK